MRAIENLGKRKPTGGRRVVSRARRAFEKDRYASETLLGTKDQFKLNVRGGNKKIRLKRSDTAVVTDTATQTSVVSKILKVVENKANRDYQRRGVITRGTIIDTEKGRARVTSRPGQQGVINAILIK